VQEENEHGIVNILHFSWKAWKNSRYNVNLKTSRARFSTLAPFVLLGILSEFVVPVIMKKISISKKRIFNIVYILVLYYPITEMWDLTLLIVKYHWMQNTVLEHVKDLTL